MIERNDPFFCGRDGFLHQLILKVDETCRMMGEPSIFGKNPDTSLRRKARKERARMLTRQRMAELERQKMEAAGSADNHFADVSKMGGNNGIEVKR